MRTLICALLTLPAFAAQATEPPAEGEAPPATVEVAVPADPAAESPAPTTVEMSVPAAPATGTAVPPAAIVDAVPAAAPGSSALPPMDFSASVAADPLFAKIQAVPAFARAEKDLPGSPIRLRVTHTLQPTAGGQAAGLLSAIVAGGTLGLLPVVTNNKLVLSYEVSVNGKPLLRRDFERAFTRAENIWTGQNDPTYGLGEDGLAWAIETATKFATEAAGHPALAELAREYDFYFAAGA